MFKSSMLKQGLSKAGLILLIFISFLLTSCANKGVVRLDERNIPIKVLQSVIVKNLPQGLRKQRKGGREFYSKAFKPEGLVQFWSKPTPSDLKRSYAIVSILGDRRPYVIQVVVVNQKRVVRTKNKYEEHGLNQLAAEKLAEKIEEQLTKSLKDRNFIDDFRVF